MKSVLLCSPVLAILGCGEKEEETGMSPDHADHADPGMPSDFDPSTEQSSSHGVTVSYASDPSPIPESSEFSIVFTVIGGTITEVDATMPTHGGHGMPVSPVFTDNGDGTYTAAPFEFQMPGYWVIHAVVANDDGNEERVDFDVDCCE